MIFGAARAFSTSPITADGARLSWQLAHGLRGTSVPLADIVNAEPAATSWTAGWGAHLTRHGWLCNVAGCQAVLVTTRDATGVMLRTDRWR